MSNIGDLSVSVTADASDFTESMDDVRKDLEQTITVIHKQEAAWSQLADTVINAAGKIIPSLISFNEVITKAMAIRRLIAFATGWGVVAIAATAVVGGLLAISRQAEETDKVISESIPEYERLSRSWDRFTSSVGTASSDVVAPITQGASAFGQWVTSFSPLPFLAADLSQHLSFIAGASEDVSRSMRDVTDVASTFAFIVQRFGASDNASARFHEQGIALREMAKSSEESITKLTGLRDAFSSLGRMQAEAKTLAERSSEMMKVDSLLTVEATENAISALRERAAAVIQSGKADESWLRHTESLFVALEKQRQGIMDGIIIDKEAEAAKRASADAAAEAARKQQELNDQGIDRIARLKDEIDILNGSATRAEIAMREMTRQGFDAEQIVAVGALTAEIDRLKQEAEDAKKQVEKTDKPKSRQREIDTSPEAAIKGSAQSFSAIFAASRRDTDERTAKASELATQELKKLNNQIGKLVNRDPVVVAGGEI